MLLILLKTEGSGLNLFTEFSSMFQVSGHPHNHFLGCLRNVAAMFPLYLWRIFFKYFFKKRKGTGKGRGGEGDCLAKETPPLKMNGIFQLICVNWQHSWSLSRTSEFCQLSQWECALFKAWVCLHIYFFPGPEGLKTGSFVLYIQF